MSIKRKKYKYLVEWNPKLGNVLKRMARMGDNVRICYLKLVGSGKHNYERKKIRKLIFFRRSVAELVNPIRFCETIIDYHKHAHGTPISVESILDDFKIIEERYPEVAETITVEELIFVDNHSQTNWNNLNRQRYMALMHRNVIKLTGGYRKAVPDLCESNVYRPLVLAMVGPFWMSYGMKNLRDAMFSLKNNVIEAELTDFEQYKHNFHHLWIDRGDISAFLVNPHTRIATVIDEPIKIRYNGIVKHFDDEE